MAILLCQSVHKGISVSRARCKVEYKSTTHKHHPESFWNGKLNRISRISFVMNYLHNLIQTVVLFVNDLIKDAISWLMTRKKAATEPKAEGLYNC